MQGLFRSSKFAVRGAWARRCATHAAARSKFPGLILLCLVFAACSPVRIEPPPPQLFADALFAPPAQRIDATEVFALNDEMKRYLQREIVERLPRREWRQGLFDALYQRGGLKLEYDSATTRNALQTFRARRGNCLSLVIMTGALARELGLSVHFRSVVVDEAWSRRGDLQILSGHVNLGLGEATPFKRRRWSQIDRMTIDFLPPEEIKKLNWRELDERTIVAMYMNNRAAESLEKGSVDDAYWWVREAINQDPGFLAALNTLGVVYLRHGNPKLAVEAFRSVLKRDRDQVLAMANLAAVLGKRGENAEAARLNARLRELQPQTPFVFLDQGIQAMRRGDFRAARELFQREAERDADSPEVRFWLAMAAVGLGEIEPASQHLEHAVEHSTTLADRRRYTAKLERLRRLGSAH